MSVGSRYNITGVPVELIFLSWLDLLAIAGIGVAAILIYVMVGRRLRHVT